MSLWTSVGVSMEMSFFTMTSFQSAYGQVVAWCEYSSSETDTSYIVPNFVKKESGSILRGKGSWWLGHTHLLEKLHPVNNFSFHSRHQCLCHKCYTLLKHHLLHLQVRISDTTYILMSWFLFQETPQSLKWQLSLLGSSV